jgi:hypothetical protein
MPQGERYYGIGLHMVHIEVVKADIGKKKSSAGISMNSETS